jgi:hypothetical protein
MIVGVYILNHPASGRKGAALCSTTVNDCQTETRVAIVARAFAAVYLRAAWGSILATENKAVAGKVSGVVTFWATTRRSTVASYTLSHRKDSESTQNHEQDQ